jgi:Ca2+-binding RTX toxin-like protein
VKYRDTISYGESPHGVKVDLARGTAVGEGHDRLVIKAGWVELDGSRHNDVLKGTDQSDVIDPYLGNDVVEARGGNDLVSAGDSGHHDIVKLGAGNDVDETLNGDVTITGGPGKDTIDATLAGPGHQTISGGSGADTIDVEPIRDGDHVSGGAGDDTLELSTGPTHTEALTADLGTGLFDTSLVTAHFLGFEDWNLTAFGTLDVTGTNGPDHLETTSTGLTAHLLGGDDSITSGTGVYASDDYVDGGLGTDYADLGDGTDTCVSVETGPC